MGTGAGELILGLGKSLGATLLHQREDNMPKVPAFHSIKEEHHHNNSKCGPGSEIPAHNKVSGDGGKPLCKDCKKLNDEGK
jgi:hypothetical protein